MTEEDSQDSCICRKLPIYSYVENADKREQIVTEKQLDLRANVITRVLMAEIAMLSIEQVTDSSSSLFEIALGYEPLSSQSGLSQFH